MTEQFEKKLPDIEGEEDAPFGTGEIVDTDTFKSTEAPNNLDFLKFGLGSNVLGWCIFFNDGMCDYFYMVS